MSDTLMGAIARIETKLDRLMAAMGVSEAKTLVELPAMTTKQHAALQMLVRGASNDEIAERFGVTINTAKVYVRGLFAKFGVNTRTKLAMMAQPGLAGLSNDTYRMLSGGLPIDWDATYEVPDRHAHLYVKEGDDGTAT
jgi:DNA-binding CsgD family transcriptional regulator